MSLLAETSALVEDVDSASVLYGLLLPWAALNAANVSEAIWGSVSRYLGLLAATAAHWDAAARHFDDALDMNARMGARPWLALTQEDYARVLLARDSPGDRGRAETLLDAAIDGFRELRMEMHAASASELLEEARG